MNRLHPPRPDLLRRAQGAHGIPTQRGMCSLLENAVTLFGTLRSFARNFGDSNGFV